MTGQVRRNVSVGLAVVILAAAFYGLGHALATNWTDVRHALHHANWWFLVAGALGAMIAVAGLAQRWHATLRTLGSDVPLVATCRWFMTGQLGKYAPGGVWHVVGQGELASRGGVPRRAAYASVMVATVTLIGGAAVVVAGGALVPGSVRTPWWAVGLGGGIIAALFIPQLRRFLLRKAGVPDGTLTARGLLRLIVGTVPTWLVIGASSWLVARAFSNDLDVSRTILAAVASWLVGIVTLPAPGGIGVREAVFAAALKVDTGAGTAALIALMARMVFLAADVAWFVIARVLPATPTATRAPTEAVSSGELSP
jgi:uncharacterized membrane protein YbhN (UPF0104 family)